MCGSEINQNEKNENENERRGPKWKTSSLKTTLIEDGLIG